MSVIIFQAVLTANTPALAHDSAVSGTVEIDGINFCNQDTADSTFGYAIVPLAETLGAKHYFEFETPLAAKEPATFTADQRGSLTVKDGAKLYVVAGNNLTTVNITKVD